MVMKGAIKRGRANSEYYAMNNRRVKKGQNLSSTKQTQQDKLLIHSNQEVNMEVIQTTLNDNGIPVGKALVKHRGKYYIVSESTRRGLETLIFEADKSGTIVDYNEVGGGIGLTLHDVLGDFTGWLF